MSQSCAVRLFEMRSVKNITSKFFMADVSVDVHRKETVIDGFAAREVLKFEGMFVN
jgi:hypothetical protein